MRDVYEIRTEEFYLRIVSLIGSSCEALPKSFTDLLIAKSSVENLRRLSSGNNGNSTQMLPFLSMLAGRRGAVNSLLNNIKSFPLSLQGNHCHLNQGILDHKWK